MYYLKKKYNFYVILFYSFFLLNCPVFSQWTIQNYDTTYSLTNVNFLNENTGIAAGYSLVPFTNQAKGVIYRTSNAGANWVIVFLDTSLLVYTTEFMDNQNWFAGGAYYSTQPKLLKSTNAGINWFYISHGEITHGIHSLDYYGSVAYAVTNGGCFRSTNGGLNWSAGFGAFSLSPDGFFINSLTGWCSYDEGKIFKTTNGGGNWILFPQGVENIQARKIIFRNSLTGYSIYDSAGSPYSKLFKSTNGGENWIALNTGINSRFYSIFFVNDNTGFVSGSGGSMIKTINAGESWSTTWTGGGLEFLSDVYFTDPYTGYTCGNDAIILKTTNGGFLAIPPISTEIPKEYSLSQNYPNPFNPNTKIKFAIPKSAFVRLAVYDMLGREVESLVNEQLTPGTYEVSWNATKFSSGIYLYRLVTNDFSLVKKMSLIK